MFDTFNLLADIRRFEILKMFFPPKGLCEAEPEWGPFDSSILLCREKGIRHLQFKSGNSPFWNSENVLFGLMRDQMRDKIRD